jgi:hypothetical protein
MRHRKDPFLFRWLTLSGPQRRFVTTALTMRRPRADGLDVVVPKLDWRAVGATCGMTPEESDETARVLSELGLIRVLNEGERDFYVVR